MRMNSPLPFLKLYRTSLSLFLSVYGVTSITMTLTSLSIFLSPGVMLLKPWIDSTIITIHFIGELNDIWYF